MCNKMSDVRLSNASPTLERVDARQPDIAKPPVCRNLFGTIDREGFQRDCRAMRVEEVRAFEERWNYDPVNDTPLSPRTCEWEAVSDAPEFYRRQPHQHHSPPGNEDLHGNNNQQDAAERNGRQADPQPARHGSRKRPAGASGGCSSECQSKRSHTDEDDDDDDEDQSGCPGSQTVTSAEQTPGRLDSRTLRAETV
ncbi:cyclin-dependent kinase inhibitor 1B-like [Centroberyx affinis]|uniref:cyclin-dependent kinase inhibitor 1B-like n=1 Tax=Centroberyx affinis TaxID=166261 RepID=UPI003A5C2F68